MTNRLVSVGDDFTLPAALKVADANLPAGSNAAAVAAKLSASAAATTYVRFVDLAGNPISARHVTIKVDTSTWEITDIVAEA